MEHGFLYFPGRGRDRDRDGDEEVVANKEDARAAQVRMVKAVYSELVRVLRKKAAVQGNGWLKGSLVAFSFLYCLLIWLGVRSG